MRTLDGDQAIDCLRKAISIDWTYWSICSSDGNLEPIRARVHHLLSDMREEQRKIARQKLDSFAHAMKMLDGMQIAAEVLEWQKKLDDCEGMYREGMVFCS